MPDSSVEDDDTQFPGAAPNGPPTPLLESASCSIHAFITSNSTGPAFVNTSESPNFSLLAVQKPAQPCVNEQNVCFPYVYVALFTVHGDIGPLRMYHTPSNPPTPCSRQYAAGISCAHPYQVSY